MPFDFVTMTAALALIGSAVIGGIFFAFSSFVMKALAGLDPTEGMRAMQSINVVVINRSFLGTFLGTAVLSAVLIVMAVLHWSDPSSLLLATGGFLYLVGTFGVTAIGNIPLNNELEKHSSTDAVGLKVWERYVGRWTLYNSVRALAAVLAAFVYLWALVGYGPNLA